VPNPFSPEELNPTLSRYPVSKGGVGSGRTAGSGALKPLKWKALDGLGGRKTWQSSNERFFITQISKNDFRIADRQEPYSDRSADAVSRLFPSSLASAKQLIENFRAKEAGSIVAKGGVGSGRKPSGRTTLPQALDRIDRVADKADEVGHTWYADGLSAKALMKAAELHSQLAQLHRAVGRRDGDSAYHSAYHSDAAAANAAASRALAGLARRVESGTAKKEHFDRIEKLAQQALSETAAATRHGK